MKMADKYVENILKLWNLELLIPKFRVENIDSEAFKYLDSSMISKLIPIKDFKMMFKSKYEQYKTQVLDQTKAEEVDLTIEDVDDFKPKLELQSSSFDIEFILQESLAGKDVMNSYEATGRLDHDSSSSLVNILIYYLISQSDDFSIDNNVLNEIADAIVTRFPTEKKEKYYYCIGEQVRGGLVDCYHIVRKRLLRKERQQRKQTSIDQDSIDGDIGPNPEQGRDNKTPTPEWVNVDGKAVVDEEMVDIKWASHGDSLVQGLPLLLAQEKFVDTTIVCEGQSIKCHKTTTSSFKRTRSKKESAAQKYERQKALARERQRRRKGRKTEEEIESKRKYDRERMERLRAEKKIKAVADMTPSEHRKMKKYWRHCNKVRSEKKKRAAAISVLTPPVSPSANYFIESSRQKIRGQKHVCNDITKASRVIDKQKKKIEVLEMSLEKYKKRLHQEKLKLTEISSLSPKTLLSQTTGSQRVSKRSNVKSKNVKVKN